MVNNMENAEEVMQILDRFTRLKQKEIPKELDDYLQYVAKTGDTVFKWSSLKYLFREKLLNVIKHFHDTTPRVDEIPQYPNVDPFNYESMKSSLLERLELFNAAPFTIQRLCELLIDPRKQYSRIDKFMRALEKNILVVSTIEPGRKRTESENGDSLDSVVNGDLSLDVNVDIDMENESLFNLEVQNGSNGNGNVAISEVVSAATAAEVKENDKEKSAVMETPNVQRKADDDILPNPKKAKLDLDIDEEVGSGDGGDVGDAVKQGENNGDIASEEKNAAETEGQEAGAKAKVEKSVSEKKEKAETVVQADKKEAETAKVDANAKEPKEENNKEMPAKVVAEESEPAGAEKASVEDVPEKKSDGADKVPEADENEKLEKAASKPVEEVDGGEVSKVESNPATGEKADSLTGGEEKIVEKDELEKSEKEETANAKAAGSAKTTEGTVTEKPDFIKSLVGDEAKETSVAAPEKDKDAKQPATASTVLDDLEQVIEDIGTSKSAPKSSAVENIPKAVPEVKLSVASVEATAAGASSTNELNVKGTTETAIVVATTAKEPEEKTETPPPAEEAIATSTAASTTATTTNAEKTESVPAIAADTPKRKEEKEEQPQPTTTAATESVAALAAADSTAAEVVAEVTNESTISVAAAAPAVPIATPTLSLNDQPMEDVLIEDVQPTVEEVVMVEPTTAAVAAADVMSTEMTEGERSKEEPAGMEVDDTSQEAMDQ